MCNLKVGEKTFSSTEHLYQHHKAIHCHRVELAHRILQAPTSMAAKRLGDSVPTTEEWYQIRKHVMREVLEEKVQSCVPFRNSLLSSGVAILAEATRDPYWGCGLSTKECREGRRFNGDNTLGCLLMDIRERY